MLNRRVEILVDEEVMEFLKTIAEQWDRSRGYVIRELIVREAETMMLQNNAGPENHNQETGLD